MLALLFALTALVLLLTALSLSRRPPRMGSRVLTLHALLGGLTLLAAAVALHATAASAHIGSAIVIATVVVVHALALSAWWQLRDARRAGQART